MACLDTSVILDLMGRGGRARQRSAAELMIRLLRRPERLTTTRVTHAELCVGVECARDRSAEEEAVARALRGLEILEVDGRAAQGFGHVSAALRRAGTPIGDFDALIAAIALTSGESLVTRNPADFGRVPGLVVETY